MLSADYYRSQADLCFKLAHSASAAKPLAARLLVFAAEYLAKATALEPIAATREPTGTATASTDATSPLNHACSASAIQNS
jgi:hypothetical protein